MRLSIVVVNWNARRYLQRCLESLRSQSHSDLEIIVVDNGSTDGSAPTVRERFPEVRLLPQDENLGFAEACNRGIVASSGEWVCLLNNDTVADPAWAAAMAAAAGRASPRCGMLQSLLLYLERPDTVNSAGLVLNRDGGGSDRREGQPRSAAGEAVEVFCPTAGAAAYRREMLEQVKLASGYFDPRHFMYFEDMDLGWRARLAGWSAQYVPEAVVFHRWHGTVDRHGDSWLVATVATNRLRMLAKNASPSFVLGSASGMRHELRRLWQARGAAGVTSAAVAVLRALGDRRQVSRKLSVPRRAVERRWVGNRGEGSGG